MNGHTWRVAVLALGLLCGCVESLHAPNDSGNIEGADQVETKAKTPQPEPASSDPQNSVNGTHVNLTDCRFAFTNLRTPRGTIKEPSPEPGAWEADDPIEAHIIDAFWCVRVGWNLLERGPVGVVIESSSITGVPAKCLGPEPGHIRYPHAIYTTEPEFGTRLAAALGIDHYASSIDVVLGGQGGPTGQVLWQPDGDFTESRVVLTAPQGEQARTSRWSDHFVTTNATTTVRLTLDAVNTGGNFNTYPGLVEFAAPSVGTHGPAKTYPVTTAQYGKFDATGVITTWPEPMCGS